MSGNAGLHDLIGEAAFYEKIGLGHHNAFRRGQVCWTHICYAQENLQFWRPQGYEIEGTSASSFGIVPAGKDRFNRSLPLAAPKLATNEEFIVVRAKYRPVILMAPAPANLGIAKGRGSAPLYRPLATVVPIFSLQDEKGAFKYPQPLIERVQKLMYPEYLYLPPDGAILTRHSFAKVCDVVTVYQPHLELADLVLCADALSVLRGQLASLQTGRGEGDFGVYRALLMEQSAAT